MSHARQDTDNRFCSIPQTNAMSLSTGNCQETAVWWRDIILMISRLPPRSNRTGGFNAQAMIPACAYRDETTIWRWDIELQVSVRTPTGNVSTGT
jgi:hypothetical protein